MVNCVKMELTCGNKKDACAQNDIEFALVKLTGRHAESPEEQETHTEEGEDAGGSYGTWREKRRWLGSVEGSCSWPRDQGHCRPETSPAWQEHLQRGQDGSGDCAAKAYFAGVTCAQSL